MTQSAKARYDLLKTRRKPYLDRAREAARVTVPSIMPPEGHNHTSLLPQPNQGFGAQCVLTLSARIAAALMPPSKGFMSLQPTPEALIEAGTDVVPDDIAIGLGKSEKLINAETNRRNWRQATNLSSQLLVVTGNALEVMQPDNTIRVFRLDQYVVVRDPSGKMVELIIEENLFPDALPEDLQELAQQYQAESTGHHAAETVPMYTWVKWDSSKQEYMVHQELGQSMVPDSKGSYKDNLLPFYALRYSMVAGEDYGRGKVEEHLADLILFDGLAKAVGDGSAMASRNITMVRPGAQGGLNLMRKVAKAQNGEFVIGNPEDVSMLQFQNVNGLQITSQELQYLRQSLGQAFLLASTVTRNAERVTATEVRMAAEELEGILGGVYTMLSQDMMLSRARRLVFQMKEAEKLPDWPEDQIEPVIVTGLEALGREAVVNAIMTAGEMIRNLPEQAQRYPKWDSLIKKLFLGLDIEDAVKTDAEVQEEMDRERELQAATNVAETAGSAAAQAAAQAAQPQQQ